ncbi:DEAD/DEAH box helicase [Sulfitobacter sp. 1A13679]|uniref:DEAD/DEAH box helicase n=1 Tax=Sulfitobacter sp. 1A13679 TaxID=3368597 RepID=UPI0037466798
MLPTPHPHQNKDFGLLRVGIKSGAKKIIFEASCGYGKSVVIQILAHSYANIDKKVLVLSNRTAVVDQLRDRAQGHPNISVMTVQTADARQKRNALETFDIILVDEAHMGGAGAQYGRVIDHSPDALTIFFTGTPTAALFELAPYRVEGHGACWLTDHGFLSPLKYICPDRLDLRKARTRNGDYVDEDVIAEIEAKDICGDAIESYRENCVSRPTLIFCQNKKHAWSVHDEFEEAGIETKVFLGGDKDDAEKLKWVADGGPLIVVDRVSAGFDLPSLHAIIVLRATSSPHLWVQILGRPARTAEGKIAGYVYDHVGNTMRCGTLTEIRDWRNGGEASDAEVTEDGVRLSVRRCDECWFVWEGAGCVCPECGEDNGQDLRISKKEAVQLRAMEAEEIEEKRRQAGLAARQAQGQAKTLKALTEEILRRPGTKNRHSAKHSARHVLESRMKKDFAAGRADDARAIHADLLANGFKVNFPVNEDNAVDMIAMIEASL